MIWQSEDYWDATEIESTEWQAEMQATELDMSGTKILHRIT